MNKKDLSERDICSKFIGPAVKRAGWDGMMQIREEVAFTKGRIIVRGKLVTRGKAKRADYILYYKPNIPIAIIEAKDNNHSISDGIHQALDYAATLNIPFVFSSNGDGKNSGRAATACFIWRSRLSIFRRSSPDSVHTAWCSREKKRTNGSGS